ncbi:MAG: hypothetical protein RLY86_3746 [Pseudomonadota bacterium]|jgi:type IV secretion system protein VirB4
MLYLSAWDDGFDALSRHLPWDCLVADGVVLLEEDGALLAVIEYRGWDQAVLGPAEVRRMAAGVATVLHPFTGGWCLHAEFQRRWGGGYPAGLDDHAASALIDGERRDRIGAAGAGAGAVGTGAEAGLVSRSFLAITWTPATAPAPARRAAAWFTKGGPERQGADVHRDQVEPFIRLVDQVAGLLARVLGQARVLTGADLLGMLHSCVSPRPMDRVAVPPVPGFPLKAAIVDTGCLPGSFPCWTNGTSRTHMRVVGILGYPSHAHPGLLNGLLGLPFPFRWSHSLVSGRFECMDQMQARGVFAALWRRHDDTSYDWRSVLLRSVGGVQTLRHDAVGMLEAMEAEAARLDAAQVGTSAGWLTPTAVVWGESATAADDRQDALVKLLRGLGFACITEGLGAERAWYGTMPGHVRPNPRKVPMTQVVLSDLMVLSSPWPGAGWNRRWNCPPLLRLEAAGGEGFNLDLVSGDDAAALVVGPPRTGKSTLLALLGHQFLARVPGGRVIWLDVDSTLSTSLVATLAAGGEHLSMGGGDLALQPLVEIDSPAGLSWAGAWLGDLLRVETVPGGAAALDRALSLLARADPAERTLTHLRPLIQSEPLRDALDPWCRGGAAGDLLDAATDRLAESPWITVDLGNLLDRGNAAVPTLRALAEGATGPSDQCRLAHSCFSDRRGRAGISLPSAEGEYPIGEPAPNLAFHPCLMTPLAFPISTRTGFMSI